EAMTTSLRGKTRLNEALIDRISRYSTEYSLEGRDLLSDPEGSDLIHEFTGKIFHEDEEGNRIAEVGKIRGARIDLWEGRRRDIGNWDVLDLLSQENYDFYGV